MKELGIVSKKVKASNRAIADLRNWIMHSKDITTKRYEDNGEESIKILYNHTGLVEFVTNLNDFFEVYDIVDDARRELAGQKETQLDRD